MQLIGSTAQNQGDQEMKLSLTGHAGRARGGAAALGVAFTGLFASLPSAPLRADVITDWDTRATAVASAAALGEREVTIVEIGRAHV